MVTRKSPRLADWNSVLPAIAASLILAGCGGSTKPAAPKGGAAAAPGGLAAQREGPAIPDKAEAAGEAPAHETMVSAQSKKKARKTNADGDSFSGDTEPLGSEQRFLAYADQSDGGSLWAIDGPIAEANVDRYALVPPPPGVDSSKFGVSANDLAYAQFQPAGQPSGTGATYALPEGFTPVAAAGRHASGLPWRIQSDIDGAFMALVPEGLFVQGKDGTPAAAPEHGVLLDSYYIDIREVTASRFEKYQEAMREAKKRVPDLARQAEHPNQPVTGVSWADAHGYAQWAGKDLPTEAQWEKGARGGDGFNFPWGNGPYIWHKPRIQGQLERVGLYKGDFSPYGLYDMAGNAREWCTDWFAEKYYAQLTAEAGSTPRNPTGPKTAGTGSQRVVKGGDPNWNTWVRTGIGQGERPADVGFRCVLRLKATSSTGKPGKKSKS